MPSTLKPTDDERARREAVKQAILERIKRDERIMLPAFDRNLGLPASQFALQSVGLEPNEFGGTVGPYRYQFEGEDDLLHLFITRLDGGSLEVSEGQSVSGFVFQGVPAGFIWLKPGEHSQHFYVAHDVLVDGWL